MGLGCRTRAFAEVCWLWQRAKCVDCGCSLSGLQSSGSWGVAVLNRGKLYPRFHLHPRLAHVTPPPNPYTFFF